MTADPSRRHVVGWRPRAALIALLVIAGLCSACAGEEPRAGSADHPNVVVIMTDDQTLESMRVMPRTTALLGSEGVSFDQSVVSFPLCCPARATFLTGQYSHNTGVESNEPPDGGYTALRPEATLPVWLASAGYTTSHVGKYLNGYGLIAPPVVPLGWDRWFGLIDPSTYQYLSYDVSVEGTVTRFEGEASYQTDVLTDRAVSEIDRMAQEPSPFYLNLWYPAPHGARLGEGATPGAPVVAPRHRGAFATEPLPDSASLNEDDISDKPAHIRDLPPLDLPTGLRTIDAYRETLESLLAVDEGVERVVRQLERSGVLEDTLVIFTSDNGLLLGEHRLDFAKIVPYEESVRVPLLVRGPGFDPGTTVATQVANLDLAATILRATGANADLPQDGIPLQEVIDAGDRLQDRPILIENGRGNRRIPEYQGVRTPRWLYVEYETGERELYDLVQDQQQLDNRADDPTLAATSRELAATLDQLRDCSGQSCRDAR